VVITEHENEAGCVKHKLRITLISFVFSDWMDGALSRMLKKKRANAPYFMIIDGKVRLPRQNVYVPIN